MKRITLGEREKKMIIYLNGSIGDLQYNHTMRTASDFKICLITMKFCMYIIFNIIHEINFILFDTYICTNHFVFFFSVCY